MSFVKHLPALALVLLAGVLWFSPTLAQRSDRGDQANITVIRVPAVAETDRQPLVVGIKSAPPFAIEGSEGQWQGITVALWEHIAEELALDYRWQQTDLEGLVEGVAEGRLDVGAAALTITPQREERLDFTHPFYTTGLGIAVETSQGQPWLTVLRRFASWQFLSVVGLLALVLLGSGLLIWLFERRHNAEQFGGGTVRGIGDGFWWSAVTMTTVGYGDKAPITLGGRIVALVWMFAGIIIISSFTAAITSSLTVGEMQSAVQGTEDLNAARVGSVADSTAAQWLQEQRINFKAYPDVSAALEELKAQRLEAVVYDAPILRYLIQQEYPSRLITLADTFKRQDYALALNEGSELREEINRVLLERIQSEAWEDTLYRYLGQRD